MSEKQEDIEARIRAAAEDPEVRAYYRQVADEEAGVDAPLTDAELDAWEERCRTMGYKDWDSGCVLRLIRNLKQARERLEDAIDVTEARRVMVDPTETFTPVDTGQSLLDALEEITSSIPPEVLEAERAWERRPFTTEELAEWEKRAGSHADWSGRHIRRLIREVRRGWFRIAFDRLLTKAQRSAMVGDLTPEELEQEVTLALAEARKEALSDESRQGDPARQGEAETVSGEGQPEF